MKPLRIRIDRIIDHGSIVSLTDIDIETAQPVTVHIDHRPSVAFWEAWCEAGCPQPIEYQAERLLICLDMARIDDDGEVRLVEGDRPAAAANDDPKPAREIEQ